LAAQALVGLTFGVSVDVRYNETLLGFFASVTLDNSLTQDMLVTNISIVNFVTSCNSDPPAAVAVLPGGVRAGSTSSFTCMLMSPYSDSSMMFLRHGESTLLDTRVWYGEPGQPQLDVIVPVSVTVPPMVVTVHSSTPGARLSSDGSVTEIVAPYGSETPIIVSVAVAVPTPLYLWLETDANITVAPSVHSSTVRWIGSPDAGLTLVPHNPNSDWYSNVLPRPLADVFAPSV
jgi:hypothetical protein